MCVTVEVGWDSDRRDNTAGRVASAQSPFETTFGRKLNNATRNRAQLGTSFHVDNDEAPSNYREDMRTLLKQGSARSARTS
jgi:hypothetical protein